MKKKKYIFPDYFSKDVVEEILKHGKENNIVVYRVGKYGKDKTISFLNYYDEVVMGLKTVMRKEKYLEKCKTNIDNLSVSCYYDIDDIQYYYDVTLKDDYPERILLHGVTDSNYGLSQKTSERKRVNDSHVDWWLYKDSTPWLAFKEVTL